MTIQDLLSVMKSSQTLPLILVSRGCEVIRIPKLRLQTIPPLKYWKVFLDKARTTPRLSDTYVYSMASTCPQSFTKFSVSLVCIGHVAIVRRQLDIMLHKQNHRGAIWYVHPNLSGTGAWNYIIDTPEYAQEIRCKKLVSEWCTRNLTIRVSLVL